LVEYVQTFAHEGGTVTNYALRTSDHLFALTAPRGWGLREAPAGNSVVLFEPSLEAAIHIRVEPSVEEPGSELYEVMRRRLALRYPEAMVTDESICITGAGQGRLLGFLLGTNIFTRSAVHVVCVPLQRENIEFELRTTATLLTNYHRLFHRFLGTFTHFGKTTNGPVVDSGTP